jgi:hypothetical protein
MYLHLPRALGALVLMSFFATLLGAKTPPV